MIYAPFLLKQYQCRQHLLKSCTHKQPIDGRHPGITFIWQDGKDAFRHVTQAFNHLLMTRFPIEG